MTRTDTPVPLRIARQAARTPDAIAVSGPGQELTYRQLDRRARALARDLRGAGAGPEDTVVLGVRRGAHWAVGLLGIWYTGAALLPVDLGAPDERLRTLVTAARARHAVVPSRADAAELRTRCDTELFWAATDEAAAAAGTDHDPVADITPGSLAYVLFTSGSTGAPKPVAVTHAALTHQATALAGRYALTADDRVLQFAAPAFDVSLEEAVPTWCTGGAAVFVEDNVLSPAELEPFLADHHVTLVNLPTPYWAQWARDVERRPRPLPRALRQVVIGSDAGRVADLVRWFAAGGPPVISSYGLTETTITATTYEPHPAALAGRPGDEVIPLGVPLPGARAYVLDGELRETAPDEPGELYIGGGCLARGYHGRPGPTAERFVADPFTTERGARMYRTGDRVRRGTDGMLAFLGRSDDQVKIRGHRVELKEVEAAVAAHPAVEEVVARALRDRDEHRLAAYVVAAPGTTVEPDDIRRFLGDRVPGYLVPSHVVVLAELPRTPGGKLDPRALPDPARAADRPLATASSH
ncbi:amino acid adenylation domain-containing protein [Streptomyces syringium]|uniref:amino acid adenylation domain-containing protein n=1 Tax=Streptomyces syringium TaxID=76729 RepID=UPI003436A896